MIIQNYELDKNNKISIALDFGCNLFSWIANGDEILACPEGTFGNEDRFYHCGNPLLFPAVGTTFDTSVNPPRKGYYKIFGNEKEYFMPQHGILKYCQWEKILEETNPEFIKVSYRLIINDKVKSDYYPFDISYEQTYILKPGVLELIADFTNNGDEVAPFVFGYHPYFKLSNSDRENISIQLPCKSQIILNDAGMSSGETVDIKPVLCLEKGIEYDNLYVETSGNSAFVNDKNADKTIEIIYDNAIKTFVLYSKADADWLCLEPWTNGWMGYKELNVENWQNMNVINTIKPGETKNIIVKYKTIL